MKLPFKIVGKNKIRDAAIVMAFKLEGLDYPKIAEKFDLSERRILQILSLNHAFIGRNKEWEKEKRINRLTQRLKTVKPTNRDELEILAELRKEIEGDKPLIDQSVHNNVVTYVWESSEDKVQSPRISA